MSDRKFKSILLKIISDHEENSNKQMKSKSIQEVDKKVRNMGEKMEAMNKEKQLEMLEMKISIK
jgi:hypothetical protein